MTAARALALYGSAHAAVDGACAALVFGLFASGHYDPRLFTALTAAYNLLAFGLQPLLALAIDGRRDYRHAAAAGCALTAAAMFLPGSLAIPAVCLAGVGNALFHLGAGSLALRMRPGCATPAGIFVAPGAIGLFLGTALGQRGFSALWMTAPVLGAFAVLLLRHEAPALQRRDAPAQPIGPGRLMLLLLLSSVAMRSLLSLPLGFARAPGPALVPLMVLAAALGKAFGGVLADRFGWMRMALWAPLLSVPLLIFGSASQAETVAAMFLVSATMPVALAAVAEAFPREPAFAFGLTAAALLVGALPALTPTPAFLGIRSAMAAAALVCALALCGGLRLGRLSYAAQPQYAK